MSSVAIVLDNEEVTCWLEVVNGDFYVHVKVHTWNKSVYKALARVLNSTSETLGIVHAAIWNDKLRKFARMYGFVDTGNKVILKRHSDDKEIVADHYIKEA